MSDDEFGIDCSRKQIHLPCGECYYSNGLGSQYSNFYYIDSFSNV